ncbi:MAG: hypothetical protein JXR76_17700 [Deltaproteobacteria bacterium]|nr:hypothetical protein [Deltaproteobacteria bacterium]
MKWEARARRLYQNIVRSIPLPMQLVAARAISRAAEKSGMGKGKSEISSTDIVEGIFKTVPTAYRHRIASSLSSMGVDISGYNDSVYVQKQKSDPEALMNTLVRLGRDLDATVNRNSTVRALGAVIDFFGSPVISIQTTTNLNSSRFLSVNFLELMRDHSDDPFSWALKACAVAPVEQAMVSLNDEVRQAFELLGYGIGLDTAAGIFKVWYILSPEPIASFPGLSHLPLAVKKNLRYLRKAGLSRISLIGFDLKNGTLDLYVMIREPACVAPDKYDDLLNDLAFETVSPRLSTQCAGAGMVRFTFSWRSDAVLHVGFTRFHQNRDTMPTQLHPLIKQCVENPVFLNGQNTFLVDTVISKEDIYFGIGNDYEGSLIDEFKNASAGGV